MLHTNTSFSCTKRMKLKRNPQVWVRKSHHWKSLLVPLKLYTTWLRSMLTSKSFLACSILFRTFSHSSKPNNTTHSRARRSQPTFEAWKPKKRRPQIPIPTKERWFWLTEQRFFAHPLIMIVTHTYSHFIINVLSCSMSKVIVFHFYKPLRHDKAIAWLSVYLPKCIRFGWLPTAYI